MIPYIAAMISAFIVFITLDMCRTSASCMKRVLGITNQQGPAVCMIIIIMIIIIIIIIIIIMITIIIVIIIMIIIIIIMIIAFKGAV